MTFLSALTSRSVLHPILMIAGLGIFTGTPIIAGSIIAGVIVFGYFLHR